MNPWRLRQQNRKKVHTHTPAHTHFCKGKREQKQECVQCEEVRKDHRRSSFQQQDTLVRQRYSFICLNLPWLTQIPVS